MHTFDIYLYRTIYKYMPPPPNIVVQIDKGQGCAARLWNLPQQKHLCQTDPLTWTLNSQSENHLRLSLFTLCLRFSTREGWVMYFAGFLFCLMLFANISPEYHRNFTGFTRISPEYRIGASQKGDNKSQLSLPTLLDLSVSSLCRGRADLICLVPMLTDAPRRESLFTYQNYCTNRTIVCYIILRQQG